MAMKPNPLEYFKDDLRDAMEVLRRYSLHAWGDGTGMYWVFNEGYAGSTPGAMGRYLGRFVLTGILCMATDLRDLAQDAIREQA